MNGKQMSFLGWKSKNLYVEWGGLCNKGCWHSLALLSRWGGQWASVQALREVRWWQRTLPKKVSPENPRWNPHGFSFSPAAVGSREMHFLRKQHLTQVIDWLWAVNPGNPALLCCFSLSTNQEIQVIYGSFLHKAGTGSEEPLSKEAVLNAKLLGVLTCSEQMFIMLSHSTTDPQAFVHTSCGLHDIFTLCYPFLENGALKASLVVSSCPGLLWGEPLEKEQHMISALGRCEGPKSLPVATTSVLQLSPPAPSTAVCSTPKGTYQVGYSEAWFQLAATSWTGWEGALLQKFLLKKLATPFTCSQFSCFYFQQAAPSASPVLLSRACHPQNQSRKSASQRGATAWLAMKIELFHHAWRWRALSKAWCGEEGLCLWESLAAAYS